MSATAKIAFIRLRGRSDAPAGTLVPELSGHGNRAISKITLGEVFPVLVDNLPADLRAEYDAWEEAQAQTPAASPPEPKAPRDGDSDGIVYEGLNKAQLQEAADARGIEYTTSATKADLLDLLNA